MTLGAKIGGSTRTHTLCGQAHPPGSATAAVEEEAQGNRGRQEACPAPEEPPQHRAKTNKQRRREEEDEGGDEEEVCRAKQVDFFFCQFGQCRGKTSTATRAWRGRSRRKRTRTTTPPTKRGGGETRNAVHPPRLKHKTNATCG